MKKVFAIIVTSLLLLTSCVKEGPVVWGATETYDSFLGYTYDTVRMTRTLLFDFNEDAKKTAADPLVFEVKEKKNGEYKAVDYIRMWKNEELCPDNRLVVTTADSEVNVTLTFKDNAAENKEGYQFYLVNVDKGGFDVVDNELELTGFTVTKKHVFNPLALGLLAAALVIAAILLVWILVVHLIVYTGTSFSRVTITYGDIDRVIRMGHAHKLVCTNTPIRRSWIKTLFGGAVRVEVNEFWERPVTITSGNRNRIRLSGLGYTYTINDETVRKQPFTVINSQGQEITIETT